MNDYITRNQKDPDHDFDSWDPAEVGFPDTPMELYRRWMKAKEEERTATNIRRLVEDQLIGLLDIDQSQDGSKTLEDGAIKVKVTSRLSRKVDADAVQEIAAEHGLTHHLPDLFRWKPEINVSAWKAADDSITKPLEAAITTKPGRPSFSIELNQNEEG